MKKLIGIGLLLLALLPAGVMAGMTCPYMGTTDQCPYMASAAPSACDPVCTPQLSQSCQVSQANPDAPVCAINGQACTASMMASCMLRTTPGTFVMPSWCTGVPLV